MVDFIPPREAELVTWSNNFDALIMTSGVNFGVTAPQAAAYDSLHTAFVSAFQTANDPSTNSRANVVAKNSAKDALVDDARELARIVQADSSVSDAQLAQLGLTVRDDEPTPVPVPTTAPGIAIVSAIGRNVQIRLSDTANPDSRGKPDGVDGASVLSFVGAAPPAPEDTEAWKFEGNIGRATATITFPPTVPSGATAWFTAFWFNPRKQSGPAAMPVSTQIPASLPQAA